jgi:hypothetical protein
MSATENDSPQLISLFQFMRVLGDPDVCENTEYENSYKLSRRTIIEHLARLRTTIEMLPQVPSPTPNTKIQDALDAIYASVRSDNDRHELFADIDHAIDSIRNDGDDWSDDEEDE